MRQKVLALRFPFITTRLLLGDNPVLDGAYRLHHSDDIARFTNCTKEVFPQKAHQFQCFGADWMGRQFALDSSRMVRGELQIAILDPETKEIFEIPCGYQEFHASELIKYPNETVEYGRFREWLSFGGQSPKYGECVSCKIPLCLGGNDTFENLVVCDLEVHWSISGQILAQTSDLPIGTLFGKLNFSEE